MSTQFRLGDGALRDAVWEVCADLGLRLSNVIPRSPSHPAQVIFVSADRLTMLHLIDDEAAGRAVVLRGREAEELGVAFARELGPRDPVVVSEGPEVGAPSRGAAGEGA